MQYTIEIKLNNKVQTTKTLNKTNKILNKKYFKIKNNDSTEKKSKFIERCHDLPIRHENK